MGLRLDWETREGIYWGNVAGLFPKLEVME